MEQTHTTPTTTPAAAPWRNRMVPGTAPAPVYAYDAPTRRRAGASADERQPRRSVRAARAGPHRQSAEDRVTRHDRARPGCWPTPTATPLPASRRRPPRTATRPPLLRRRGAARHAGRRRRGHGSGSRTAHRQRGDPPRAAVLERQGARRGTDMTRCTTARRGRTTCRCRRPPGTAGGAGWITARS